MKIKEIVPLLGACHRVGNTLLVKGEAGIGKSDIVRHFCKENNFHRETLLLGNQDVGDLIGIPHTKEVNGETVTVWSKPVWLQRMIEAAKAGKHVCLFLDELNRAQVDVKGAALQLVLDREIHQHKLPELDGFKCLVVAAINPDDSEHQSYQVDELDPALLDRFLHVDAEVDVESWLEWARDNKISEIVREFIAENEDAIYNIPQDGGRASTPRSLAMLGAHVDDFQNIPVELHLPIITGMIGTTIGARFYDFYSKYHKILKMEDIENAANKEWENSQDIVKCGEKVNKLFVDSGIEQFSMVEKIEQLMNKYLPNDDSDINKVTTVPLFAALHGLHLETLAGVLHKYSNHKQEENVRRTWKQLIAVDAAYDPMKKLFKKVSNKRKIQ